METPRGDPVNCTAAVLPRSSYRAAVMGENDRTSALTAVRDLAVQAGARVAINGGRFNGAFQPDGLLIIGGKVLGRKRADWDGFLTVDPTGRADVTTRPDLRAATYAVQGWPTLLQPDGSVAVTRNDTETLRLWTDASRTAIVVLASA